MTTTDALQVTPAVGALGAEITGVDLSGPISDDAIEQIKQCLWQHHVICFRDQQLTPEAQTGFARRIGPLKKHPYIGSLEGHPEIMVVRKEPEDQHNFAGAWHTDTSYQETPALASMLYAIEVPADLGDTFFCNMVAACEALSPTYRQFLDSLEAVHSFAGGSGAGREQDLGYGALANDHDNAPKVVQQVVRTHPQSGTKALYVNPMFTEHISGLTNRESDSVLKFLYDWCTQADFLLRLRWRPGTVTIWDNLTTMHYPLNDYHGHRRVMHRVVIDGTERSGRSL